MIQIKRFKLFSALILLVISLTLISCNSQKNVEAYAVVHYESIFTSKTGKIIFGQEYLSDYNKATVYHYDSRKKKTQVQPSKTGNMINNPNANWDKVESFEIIEENFVYIKDGLKYKKINDDKINIYKITKHFDYGTMIQITEIFVIKVEDIKAFDFNYKIEGFND